MCSVFAVTEVLSRYTRAQIKKLYSELLLYHLNLNNDYTDIFL
jgi:hypothetical protein